MPPTISILGSRSDPSSHEVSIAQISATGMALHWYESVAIAQELCRVLGNQAGHPTLDWSTVFVQPSGDITIRSPGSSGADDSVRALGELLRTWLVETAYPMPLSLVVAQATSTPPFYRSAAELSEALSHYERPNRSELIRNVYERCRSSDPASDEPAAEIRPSPSAAELRRKARAFARSARAGALSIIESTRTAVRALPRRVRRAAVPADATAQRRFPWVRLVAALTLVLAIAGWVIVSGIGRPAATTAGFALGRADDRLTDAVAARLGAVVNWVGRRFVRMPTGSSTSSAPPSPDPPMKATRRNAAGTSPARPGGPPDEAPDVSGVSGIPDRATAAPAAVQEPAPPAPPPDTSMVYSGADTAVTPPVAIDRQLQDPPPAGARSQNGVALEIVVDQMGRVESATLAKPPATLQETMQATMNLSAAKSWRFRPALKGGQPVRYRRTVWLANR